MSNKNIILLQNRNKLQKKKLIRKIQFIKDPKCIIINFFMDFIVKNELE